MRAEQLRDNLAALDLGPIELRSEPTGPATEITDVVQDSRAVNAGAMFCAVRGQQVDGHRFIDAAVANGASALLVETFAEVDCPQIKVANVRVAMAHAAAAIHGHPSKQLALAGITGTNGKTTTTQLIASIAEQAGRTCGVVGTLDGTHTTPDSTELQRYLRDQVQAGGDIVALEVSSHALEQNRVDATEFAVAAFSNLSPDHLDYHGDMASYFDAKRQLFDGRAKTEIVNIDDPWGARLAELRPAAQTISASALEIDQADITGTSFRWRGVNTYVPLPGDMNVANALMAAECALALGIEVEVIAEGLQSARLVPGRMELVQSDGQGQPMVIVDYSHTPDSIDRALATLRPVVPATGSLAIVFGCGGDRDRTKRPLMAAAAERGADRVYLTNDNPRSEDPLAIIADASKGFDQPGSVVIEPDREVAIRRAITEAGPGDVVLIAGKGHEKTQTIGPDVLPFDDVHVARVVLEAK
jgi:UDP-N-acetylmuramoyl-L-alanyl-D-glutamate--2,6-diaminopimelate ligase